MINKLKDIFLLCLGFLFITYVFTNRFIRERIPHEITFNFHILALILFIIFVIMSALRLHKQIKKLLNMDHNNKWMNHPLIKPYIELFNVIQNALDKVLDVLLITYIMKIIIDTLRNLLLPLTEYNTYIYIFFISLPRLLVAITFFIDVCIFNEFYYFYKALPLLILPLVITSIAYIFKYWANKMREELKKVVRVHIIKDTDPITGQILLKVPCLEDTVKNCDFKFREEVKSDDYHVYIHIYMYSIELLNFEAEVNDNADKKGIIINDCIIKLLFIISWMYIIIKMVTT